MNTSISMSLFFLTIILVAFWFISKTLKEGNKAIKDLNNNKDKII